MNEGYCKRLLFAWGIIFLFVITSAPLISDKISEKSDTLVNINEPEDQAYYSNWNPASRTDLNSTFGGGFNNSDDSLINAVTYNSTHVFYTGYRVSLGVVYMWWGFRTHSSYSSIVYENYWSAGIGTITEGLGIALNANSSRLYIVGHCGNNTYGPNRGVSRIGFVVGINLYNRTLIWNKTIGSLDIEPQEIDGESMNDVKVDGDGNVIVVGSQINTLKSTPGEEVSIQKLNPETGELIGGYQVPQNVVTGFLVSVKGVKIHVEGTGSETSIFVLAQKKLKQDSINGTTSIDGVIMRFDSNLALQFSTIAIAGGLSINKISDMAYYQNKLYIVSTWVVSNLSYGNLTAYNNATNSIEWTKKISDTANHTFDCIAMDSYGTLFVGGTRVISNTSVVLVATFDADDGYVISYMNGSLVQNHTITSSYFISDQYRIFGNYLSAKGVSMVYQCVRQNVQQPVLNGLSSYTNNESILLTWSLIQDALGYDIYRATSPIVSLSGATRIGQVGRGVVSFLDEDLKAHGTTYYFAVHAWNNFTNDSSFSNVVSTTYYAPLDQINLAPPNQTFYLNGSTIRLEWNVVQDARYLIYESRNINTLNNLDVLTPDVTIYDSNHNWTEFTHTEVGIYYYRVRAFNSTRGNQTSAIVAYSIETKAKSPSVFLIRGNLADIYDGIAYLSWVHPDPSSEYTFHIWRYYLTTTGQKRDEQKIASVNTTVYIDMDLPSYNFYYYIRAENRTGLADTNSSHFNITIRRLPQHPTLQLKSDVISRDGKINFTWNVTAMTETQVVVRRYAGSEATAKIDRVYESDGSFVQGIEFRAEFNNTVTQYSESGLRKGYWLYYVVAKNSMGAREIDPTKTLVIYVDTGGMGNMTDSMMTALIVGGSVMAAAIVGYLIYKKKVDYSW